LPNLRIKRNKNKNIMALPKTVFNLTNGNLGRIPLAKNSISAFVFYNDNVADLTTFTATSRVNKFNNLTEIEATGITSVSTNFQAEYYQLSEYFRLGGGQIWIGVFAEPTGAYNFNEVDTLRLASNGEPRQYAVMAQENALTVGDVALLQAKADSMFTLKKPAHILYAANIGSIAVSALADMRNLAADCENVSVVIGQDMKNFPLTYSTANNVSLPNIGVVLGALSGANVSTNILWVERFNYTDGVQMVEAGLFCNDGSANNKFVPALSLQETTLDAVNDKGYVFWRYLANVSGTYLSNDNNSTDITSDYNSIALIRTINEAVRLVDAEVSKKLGSPVLLNNGVLSVASKGAFRTAALSGLKQLEISNDITSSDAEITYTVGTKTINVALSITPAFSADNIVVNLGYSL